MNGKALEVNFDGIVGPTHNYSGLSYGNIASMLNQEALSNPREAALQGLEKMKLLTSLGLAQGVLPPHERPHLSTLRALGYGGSEAEILAKVSAQDPELLYAVSSAASMWTANAATVSSASDTVDGLMHVIPANLVSKFHRSIEAYFTGKVLKFIFNDSKHFMHHEPLPACAEFADEGAANHSRLCSDYASKGVHLFVYGRSWKSRSQPKIFPARQTLDATQALARLHRLPDECVVFAQQHPDSIDAGVFHNDVASVGNKNVFLYHEKAFAESDKVLQSVQQKFPQLNAIKISDARVSLKDTVDTYLFNSQLISLNEKGMILIAPTECSQNAAVKTQLEEIVQHDDNPIKGIIYMNLRESMRNGGGPACLRLRVVLSQAELQAAHSGVFLTDDLYVKLKTWVRKHYRDRLMPRDLADPHLLEEVRMALDELTKILQLGPIYSFQ